MGRRMWLASRPFSLLFCTGSHTLVSLRRAIRSLNGSSGFLRPDDVATCFQKHASGAAHHGKAALLRRGHRQRPLAQQQLRRDHRGFCLAMHHSHSPAHQRDLLQRPLVGSEKSFVFPPPPIASARRLQGQLCRIFHIREQPHVHLDDGNCGFASIVRESAACPRFAELSASSRRSPRGTLPTARSLRCKRSRSRTCE